MERPEPPQDLSLVLAGFELAHAMLGSRTSDGRPLGVLDEALTTALDHLDPGAARRAANALGTRLMPTHTRHLDARAKALLGAEVGGATGRRWMRESPTRPGFAVHPGIRACVRALAVTVAEVQ